MMRWMGLLCAVALFGPLAHAAGSAEAGAMKATTCGACHGPNGNSTNPQWPVLAGQNAIYLQAQLQDFHDRTRIDPTGVMPTQATNLTPQDIEDLAAYFSTQVPSGLEADPSYWQPGEKLYRAGDPSRDIPACIACHGPVGRGAPAAGFPQLRAQHAVYVLAQLMQYASDTRYTRDSKGASNGGEYDVIMHTIASRLTPQDMRDIASYVQGMR
ncbi:MAG TPA: c-type cytochrome [Steroidobacteraceae bacterium]|nr:c-type cytochrome [Steroidobacteraceae bacterium]